MKRSSAPLLSVHQIRRNRQQPKKRMSLSRIAWISRCKPHVRSLQLYPHRRPTAAKKSVVARNLAVGA
jgi:hypothetical protein